MDSLDSRNAQLDQKIEATDLPKAVQTLVKDAARRKHQLIMLAITIGVDVLLTIGFGYVTIRTHNLASQADSNRDAIVRSCETTNEGRANNKKLWVYILGLSPSQQRTPEQTRSLDKFRAFVDETFAPKDCSTIK